MRRVGPAWLEQGPDGKWLTRRGRVPDGYFDERRAHVKASELVTAYEAEKAKECSSREQLVTFRELANDYMHWLATDYGAKPTTLRDHAYQLAEPGTSHRRGSGASTGRIMRELGDSPAAEITTDDVRRLLSSLTADGLSARNVNKYGNLIGAIFNHGVKRATGRLKLSANPTVGIELRRERKPAPLIYFSPEEIEAISCALAAGTHRAHEQWPRTLGLAPVRTWESQLMLQHHRVFGGCNAGQGTETDSGSGREAAAVSAADRAGRPER